jgi:hypothetical protein
METLNSHEQQRLDEVLRLEIAYSNLSRAFATNNKHKMLSAIGEAFICNQPHIISMQNGIDTVFRAHYGYNYHKIIDWSKLTTHDAKLNVKGCMKAISKLLSEIQFYETNYTYAQSILYQPNHTFNLDDVIHQNQQGQQLKVADLLAVSKYAISIAEAVSPDNEDFAKANAAITTFQGIDAILNNKPENKPVNKMLHLATSFLSSVVKASLKDKEAKRGVTIAAITLDLVIDFFCKK